MRGSALGQAGRYDEALAISTRRSASTPITQAYYNRGLSHQSQQQHGFAIDDFSAAIGLSIQQAQSYIAHGLSYLAMNNVTNAASDLDDAVNIDPQNVQAWTSRGLAYERLGDKEKAAGSYTRTMNIDKSYRSARGGFVRVGGRFGQAY